MILTDELCDKLCAAAREKSKEMGIYISKMDYPGHTIVTEKHWFSVSFWYQGRPITQCETKEWLLVPEKAVLLWQSRQTILNYSKGVPMIEKR